MKKQKNAINILLFMAILEICACGNAIAQNNTTIAIGSQRWCTTNLNVSSYRNGDAIPQVEDGKAWASLTTGAWCYYKNKTENGITYGKLYNWYAVNDPRGLAPEGYHIPSDSEWTTLSTFLGGESFAGGKMKEKGTTHWSKPNKGASNESGFLGLPGGARNPDGSFGTIGEAGFWMCSGYDTISGLMQVRLLNAKGGNVFGSKFLKTFGTSVRCLKD
jgi:uncharacterized protein (TIGR02145 family)